MECLHTDSRAAGIKASTSSSISEEAEPPSYSPASSAKLALVWLAVLMFLLPFEQTSGRFPAKPAGLTGCRGNCKEKLNKRKYTKGGGGGHYAS